MAEVVDSIIAELVIKGIDQYEQGFNRASAAHGKFQKSVDGLKAQTFDLSAEGQKYKAGLDIISGAEEQTTAKVTRTRKARVDAVKQSGNAEVQAEIATQQRITKAVDDGIAARSGAMRRGSGTRIGATVQGRADSARQGLMTGVSSDAAATAEVAAEQEVNAALVEQTRLQAGLVSARGADRRLIQEQLADMRTYNGLLRSGLDEEAAAVELDRIRVARAAELAVQQAASSRSAGAKDLTRFAEGAGLGRSFGSTATVAGIATAVGVGVGVAAIESASAYAKSLTDVSKAAGISTDALQVYQRAAERTGATQQQFNTALSELSDNLGRARTGSEEQAKAFAALGVNIKTGASAGALLPTLIERISSISDQAKRARIETALFGEAGRQLDGLLSGGNDAVNSLADALQRTGSILSSADIQRLGEVEQKLEAVKAQLSVDLAQVVAGNKDVILELAQAFVTLANDVAGAIKALDDYEKRHPNLSSPIAAGQAASKAITGQDHGLFGYAKDTVNSALAPLDRALGLPAANGSKASQGVDYDAQSKQIDALSAKYPSISDQFKVQPGKVDQGLLDTLGAPKGRKRKGPNPDTLANEADERTKRFNDEMARYREEQLQALEQQDSDEGNRRQAEIDAIDRESDQRIADLKIQAGIDARKKGADERLISARLAQAITAEQAAAAEKKNVISLQDVLSAISRQTEADNAVLGFKNQQLSASESLARTADDRRKIELEILANDQEIAKNNANLVLKRQAEGDPSITNADVDAANRTLKNLPADTASKTAVIDKQTQGPLASYIDGLPKSAKEVDEAFQDAAVHGLQSFNTQLADSVSHMLKLHGIAGQFLDDIVQIGIKWAEAQLLGGQGGGGIGSLFGGYNSAAGSVLNGGNIGGGGGLGGLLGKLGGLFGLGGGAGASSGIGALIGGAAPSAISGFSIDPALLALPGLAGGGTFQVNGRGGVDQNIVSINGKPSLRLNQGETVNVVPTNQRVNSAMSRQPTLIQQTVHVDARNSVNPDGLEDRILAKSAQVAQALDQHAARSTLAAAPGAVRQTQVLKG